MMRTLNVAPWEKEKQEDQLEVAPWEQQSGVPEYYRLANTYEAPTPSRGLWAINDYVIEAANAILGGGKALVDFAVPGTELANQIEGLIQQGAESQSQVAQQAKQQLSQDIEAGGMQALKGVGSYVLENPLLAASQAVGSFALPGTAIKGAQAAARGLGIGQRAATAEQAAVRAGIRPYIPGAARAAGDRAVGRVGLGAGALTGAALGGGDAAGQAYDIVMQETGNEALALQAARDASIAPAAIGGLTGLIGAERLFAGLGKAGRGGRIKTATTTGLSEAAQETFEEGATQLSANLAAQQFVPELDVMKGVVGSAALGFALGGITGGGIGFITGGKPQDALQTDISTDQQTQQQQQLLTEPTQLDLFPGGLPVELAPPSQIINPYNVGGYVGAQEQGLDTSMQFQAPTGQQSFVMGQGPVEQVSTQAPARAAQPAAQQTQGAKPPQAQAPQIDPAVAQQIAQAYGVSQVPAGPGVPTQAFTIAGKTVMGVGNVNNVVREIAQANQNKDPDRVQLESAIVASGIPIGGQPTAKGILGGINNIIKKYQLDGAATLGDAANILEFQIGQAKSPKSVEPMARIYEALTGQMSPAFQRLTEGPTTETTPLKFGLASSITTTAAPTATAAPTVTPTPAAGTAPLTPPASLGLMQPTGAPSGQPTPRAAAPAPAATAAPAATTTAPATVQAQPVRAAQPVSPAPSPRTEEVTAGAQAWEDMNVSTVQYSDLSEQDRADWDQAVAEGRATGEAQEQLAKEYELIQEQGFMQQVLDRIIGRVIKSPNKARYYSTFLAAGAKQQDIIAKATENAERDADGNLTEKAQAQIKALSQELSALRGAPNQELAAEYGVALDTLKEWNQGLRTFLTDKAAQLQEAARVVAVELRLEGGNLRNVLSQMVVRHQQAAADFQAATQLEQTVFDQTTLADPESGMAVLEGRTAASVQEVYNASETVNARFLRLQQELVDAENDGNQELADEITAKLDALTEDAAKQASGQTAKRAPAVKKEKKDAVPKRETEKVSVQPKARVGEKVGQKVRVAKEPAAEGETQTQKEEVTAKPVDQLTDDEWSMVIGPISGPARPDAKNEEISIDDVKLLKKMIIKIIKDGVADGKTSAQIVDQIEAITKGGIKQSGIDRIYKLLDAQKEEVKTTAVADVSKFGRLQEYLNRFKPLSTQNFQMVGSGQLTAIRKNSEFKTLENVTDGEIQAKYEVRDLPNSETKRHTLVLMGRGRNNEVFEMDFDLGTTSSKPHSLKQRRSVDGDTLMVHYPGDLESGNLIFNIFGSPRAIEARKSTQVTTTGTTKAPSTQTTQAAAVLTAQEAAEAKYNELRQLVGDALPTWDKLSDAQRAALVEIDPAQMNMRDLQRIVDDSRTIDVEAREVSGTERQLLLEQTNKLNDSQVKLLENEYGAKVGTDSFVKQLSTDVSNYVNKGAEFVSAKIRAVIKAIASGVLAIGVVFNPNVQLNSFSFDLPSTYASSKTVITEVPADAAPRMSALAQSVYVQMANAAQKSGKGFIIADKPNGMIHLFNADGSLLAQDTALYGKDVGDSIAGQKASLEGGPKVTPAGQFELGIMPSNDYAGGFGLTLQGTDQPLTSPENLAKKRFNSTVAVHAAYLGDVNERRLDRLASKSAKDNRISYGCINTSHDLFINKIKPNAKSFDGGMIFVLPDNPQFLAEKGQLPTPPTQVAGTTRFSISPSDDKTRGQFMAATQRIDDLTGRVKNRQEDADVARTNADRYANKYGKNKFWQGLDEQAKIYEREVQEAKAELRKAKDEFTTRFSKRPGAKGSNAATLRKSVVDFIGADNQRKLVVVQTVKDIDDTVVAEIEKETGPIVDGTQGFVHKGKAYLIASNIEPGTERAVFMHEVGSHLGLENILSEQQFDTLVDKILEWSQKTDNSLESQLAIKALVRVASADPMDAVRNTELVAYFIEEAIIAGVDPTAVKTQVGFGDWFRTLWSAFKRAIRKLGFNPEKMDAFDIVNMAYGAARMEIAGTWHGTASKFRKFDHRFMGTGEGAQAYGWGTYLAQRAGIAYQYLIKDIKKKAGAPKKGLQQFENEEEAKQYFDTLARELGTAPGTVYSPITQEVFLEKGDILSGDVLQFIFEMGVNGWIIGPKPNNPTEVITSLIWTKTVDKETGEILKFPKLRSIKGNLLRIDVNAQDNELLNWDIALKDQKEVYDKLNKNLSDFAKEQLNLELDSQLGTFTGSDLYQALKNVVFKTQGLEQDGFITESELKTRLQRLVNSDNISARSDELVSKYLDSIGIKGIRFLDSASREPTRSVLLNKINSYERVIKDLQSYGTAQIAIQQYQKIVNNAKKALETALPDSELTRNLVIFNEKNIFRVLAKEVEFDNLQNKPNIVGQKTKFSIAPAQEMAAEQALNVFKSRRANSSTNVSGVPSTVRTAADTIYQTLRNWTRKGVDRVVFTEALINRAVESGIMSAAEFKQLMQARGVETRKFEKEVERIADMYALVPDKDRGTGSQSVNAFIYDSTRTKKWGFQPKWRSTGVAVDGDLEIRFNALSSEAQSFIRAVFKHGDDTLALKKKILMDYTNSEYDAQIKAAQADGNAELIAELQKEKIADLKKFDTLFKLREGIPYAPLKRIGKYAVVAKSPEYRAAEDVDDKKRIRELEQDPNHYHVTFVDSNIQAINLQKQLQDQGFYGTSEDAVYYFERKSPDDKLYASDTIAVLSRLRAKVDSSIDQDSKTTNQLRKIITDMYLHTLADASARKSELRRRNVPGEIDMLQSFALQGRADANFLAAIQYNDRTQKTIKKMEREAQRSGNRARKSELFNELNARYIQSLEYEPNQMVQKLNRLTSVYFLASSPGYYLQNFTQPWMMSLPVMAGRHDYTKSANALYNAYFDLKDVMKSAKLFDQQFDFSKVPDDIKDVVETLVNRSQIDIGISTEMGEFTIEGQGPVSNTYNKVDKGLRLAVQKVEAINRLTTAIAAYRLELAKTGNRDLAVDYASSIINDTHGDYSAFNAPRMFNTNVGKVALQFRKFQLIQLGLLAKLIKNSFEKGPEQQVARKALGYILAQTAVLTGVMGMPGAAAIAWALEGLLGDEDEPYDIKGQIRDAIGNNDIANIVLYGSPNLAGVNLSGKIGMGNALSVMPFTEIKDLNGEKTYQIIGTLLGGPAGGMAARMADGMSYIAAGDEYKGLELMLPKGLGDAMRSVRVYNEGFTSRRGDVLLPPDQIGEVTAFWQFLGLTPTQTSVRGEQQGRTIDIEQKFSSRSSTLKRQYEQAAKDQDRTKQAELRRQWLDLQAARVRNGYPRKPMSELTRAPQEQRKRERQTSEGVPFTDSSRRFVERITA
jgi:hypothetical protein